MYPSSHSLSLPSALPIVVGAALLLRRPAGAGITARRRLGPPFLQPRRIEVAVEALRLRGRAAALAERHHLDHTNTRPRRKGQHIAGLNGEMRLADDLDRKSTRLNSSH